MKDTVTLDR